MTEIILVVDVGTKHLGFSVWSVNPKPTKIKMLDIGTVHSNPKLKKPVERIHDIIDQFKKIIEKYDFQITRVVFELVPDQPVNCAPVAMAFPRLV
jgi:Holliday junction resolvasome RuvABC endonuclease subunit